MSALLKMETVQPTLKGLQKCVRERIGESRMHLSRERSAMSDSKHRTNHWLGEKSLDPLFTRSNSGRVSAHSSWTLDVFRLVALRPSGVVPECAAARLMNIPADDHGTNYETCPASSAVSALIQGLEAAPDMLGMLLSVFAE